MTASGTPSKPLVSLDDFRRIHLAAAQVVHVEVLRHQKQSAYRVRLDFGAGIGERWSIVQATREYSELDMQDKVVIAVVNVPPRRIFGTESEVLILGVEAADGSVSLLEPSRGAKLGSDVY